MTSARRRAILEARRAEHRGRWRARHEVERIAYLTRGTSTKARAHIDAWEALGYGVPLSIILQLAFGANAGPARRRAAKWLRVDNLAQPRGQPCNPAPPTG